jgi:hypothetical protein
MQLRTIPVNKPLPTPIGGGIISHEGVSPLIESTPQQGTAADQLAASLRALVAGAGLTEPEVRRILDQELSKRPLGLSEDRVRSIAQEVAAGFVNKVQVVDSKTGYEGPTIDNAHAYLSVALHVVMSGVPLLLFGEKGCGKTTLAAQLAKALELNFAHISCNKAMTAGKLVGFANPMNGSEWFRGELTRHLESASLVLLDEADAGDPGVQLCLNSVLANRYIGEPSGLVHCHEKFQVVMAANTINGATRQYNGREKLDDALLDRMAILELPLDNSIEARFCGVVEKSTLDGSLTRGGLITQKQWLADCRAVRHVLLAKGLKQAAPSPRAPEWGARLCSTLGSYWLREMLLVRGAGPDVRNVIEAELKKQF